MWQTVTTALSLASYTDWLLLILGLLLVVYIAGTWNYDYFQRRGIPSSKPLLPFLGDMTSAFLGLRSFPNLILDQYKQSEGTSVYGFFEFTTPIYLVRDPEVLKVVTVKEFDNFMNHRAIQSNKTDPLFTKNLFNLTDQTWRDMRATLSPAFTTSKIKAMFPLISQCGSQMAQHLQKKYEESPQGKKGEALPTDMKSLFGRMANDVIATAAFGVGCDSLEQPENEFYRMGKTLTNFSKLRTIVFMAYLVFPKIAEALRLRVLDSKATHFFDSLVHETISERQKKGIFRPDVLQLLMQAREGQLKADKEDAKEAEEVGAKRTKLSDEDLSAQAIIFFFAGFETVSTALCLVTTVLSHHPEVQKRLQEEVAEVMKKTDGKPTYEAVQGMKYLDAVINETLRLYPPAVGTDRQCQGDTQVQVNGTTITFRRGQTVSIPILGIHLDPEHWPEPTKFDPDRFSDENKHNIKPFTYMPFGVGPRICIGQRFALIEVKLLLVYLLGNYELFPNEKTKYPLEFEVGFNIMSKGGFWCNLKPRQA